jgi:hypothetical protein
MRSGLSKLILAGLVTAAVPAILAAAEGPAPPAVAPASGTRVPGGADGRRTVRRLPANLGRSVVGVFHKDNLVPFLGGGAATGVASIWDEDVRRGAEANNWGESLETAGGPVWSSVFVAGMFTAGRLSHGTRFRAMTYDMLDATIVNLAYTELIKVTVGRERPNGQDEKSFPSGHTSNAFALAAVAERHYGWKIGIPAYLAAGLIGASRIQQDKHYLSDVVAGATLGYIVGRTVVRVNGRPLEGGAVAHRSRSLRSWAGTCGEYRLQCGTDAHGPPAAPALLTLPRAAGPRAPIRYHAALSRRTRIRRGMSPADDTTLLRTKLHHPPVADDVVPRLRLLERLEPGRRHTLTLVSTPAGYGKSTLLSSWLDGSGCQRLALPRRRRCRKPRP